jgi:hypothetical protein
MGENREGETKGKIAVELVRDGGLNIGKQKEGKTPGEKE